jgi:hypothetical protein
VNGTIDVFDAATSQILTLNLANGKSSFVSDVDPANSGPHAYTPSTFQRATFCSRNAMLAK